MKNSFHKLVSTLRFLDIPVKYGSRVNGVNPRLYTPYSHEMFKMCEANSINVSLMEGRIIFTDV